MGTPLSNRHDVTLELNSLIAAAFSETGLEDFGDATVRDRAGKVIAAYAGMNLPPMQQAVAAESILDILVTRLKLEGDRKLHPEIAREAIDKPVVVVGFARSGTTLMYSLLAADPQARSPSWWDALHPSPPPGLSPEHDHLRKQIAHRELAEFLRVVPIRAAHNYVVKGADMSLECYVLWALDFRSMAPFLYYRVEGFPGVALGGSDDPTFDLLGTYRFEKRLLQNLQWRRPTGHWVLKDPAHHFNLPEMNQVFPDATFVWPHRDPAQVFASLVELIGIITGGMMRAHVDRRDLARTLLPTFAAALDRILDHPIVDAPNVIHVAYEALTRDPIAAVRNIYRQMGREFSPRMLRNIEEWRDNPNNRSDLYGKFKYAPDDMGFSAAEIRHLFRRYIERFDIPIV